MYLQLLIDELKELQNFGVEAYGLWHLKKTNLDECHTYVDNQ